MKKTGIILVIIAFMSVSMIGAAMLWWKKVTSAVSDDVTSIRFVIPKGQSAEKIGVLLEEKKLIKNALGFKIYVQIFDKQSSINSGEFQISPSMTLEEIVEALGKGPAELWVTIPEGLRREELPERFSSALKKSDLESERFAEEFLLESEDLEGFLFPDTYLFSPDVTAQKVITTMKDNFNKKFDSELHEEMVSRGLTLGETVILASIIEKETKTDTERPVVAGIYFNRLSIGQALQADATVQYPLGTARCSDHLDCDWWSPPSRADLKVDSPYNTYKYSGLPVGPIASPGLSSLRAVVYSEDSEYYYYIHDGAGEIHYAQSFDDHKVNIQRYLR